MDAKALEALKKAIKKWNKKRVVDHGVDNCALCSEFYSPTLCKGCPVAEKAGMGRCLNTPYVDWIDHHEKDHSPHFPHITSFGCLTCKDIAQAELDFLKSLLPEEAK